MFRIKLLNEISGAIHDFLPPNAYTVSRDESNPDGILVRSANCHDMELPPSLLAIARAGVGVNNIPLEKCIERGVVVFNTPGANANAVKELVLSAIFASSRHLFHACSWTQSLKGQRDVPLLIEQGKSQFLGREVKGKTIGVVGLGAIGVSVANDCHAIGMNVYGYDPFISIEHAWGLSRAVHRAESMEDLLLRSDYITLHIPLIDKTRGFFGERYFKLVKPGAVLLNFARAELVETKAMLCALASGALGSYVVDFPTEDVLGIKGVLAIPHLGASTPESEENCARMAASQLHAYLQSGAIKNAVSLPDCDMPRSGSARICIVNSNRSNMVGQIAAVLASENANIANMLNKSRGDYAYTMIDLDEKISPEALSRISGIDGVIRVRIFNGA